VVPDFTVAVTACCGADTWGLLEWVLSGTHHGKRFSVRGATIVELREGKIRRCSDYFDAATFMRQVGLLPAK
jgi:ketosteroid isomerase-like protein